MNWYRPTPTRHPASFAQRVYDVATSSTEVIAHGIHINLRICQFQIPEEDAIEVVVVVLAGMSQNNIEVFTAFIDDCGKADNLRACADNNYQLQFAVVLKFYI